MPTTQLVITTTGELLKASSAIYNALPSDEEQPDVSQHHLCQLAALFMQFKAQKTFGLHLIHRHLKIGKNQAMIGETRREPLHWWTTPTDIEDIDSDKVYGHVFKYHRSVGFLPYEFRIRGLEDVRIPDAGFFLKVGEYLLENNLTELLGLQLLESHPQDMSEVVLNKGTAMLAQKSLKHGTQGRTTGWYATEQDGTVSFKGNETHYPSDVGHKKFYDGKLYTTEALLSFFEQQDVI